MKRQFKLFAFLILIFLVGSCNDKSGEMVKDPVAPVLNTPDDGSTLVIDGTNLASEQTFGWEAADFGAQVAVSYEIQIDIDGGAFANPSILSGDLTGTSVNVTYEAINDAVIDDLAQETNTEVAVDVRVVATSAGFDDLISNVIGMTITTYEEEVIEEPEYANIWVAGTFQGWDNTNFISLTSAADNGVYEGYLYLPEGQLDFKLYENQNDWGPDSWGTDNDGSGTIYVANEACCNFAADAFGTNWVEVDIPNLTYKLVAMSWGIIGDATPTGWDSDTELVYNSETQALEVTLDLVAAGSFKFRANGAWQHDFGVDADGKLAYADHLTDGYTEGINNITVSEDGNYTVTLDLHNSNEYTYSVVKN
ncbi:MAG: SusE domain-containing protein [Cyclobacteriaceae bacterium]|nr:SusE domain-containing protein [Cyclobacteriaceae bacterium]